MLGQIWWYMFVIPATQEADIGGSWFQTSPAKAKDTI
jgi:hypothetical protein